MKTTLLTRLFASVVLALGLTAVNAAPIPLEEVKVGSTVTSEGIGIGWGKYLPVPEGEWEVVVRDEMTYFSSNANPEQAFSYFVLLNKDEKAPLQLVSFNYVNPRSRMSADISCSAVNTILNDRMGTAEGQNFQLCKRILKPIRYDNAFKYNNQNIKLISNNRTEREYLKERFGENNPKLIVAFLKSGKLGSYFPPYHFGFNIDSKNPSLESSSIQSIDKWLTFNANKVDAYFNGERIKFSEFSLK